MKYTRKTSAEISQQIAHLKAAKAYAPKDTKFGDDNHAAIDLQIQYLEGDIDTTAEEFEDFSEHERSAITEAEEWKDGRAVEDLHAGWDIYKK